MGVKGDGRLLIGLTFACPLLRSGKESLAVSSTPRPPFLKGGTGGFLQMPCSKRRYRENRVAFFIKVSCYDRTISNEEIEGQGGLHGV